MPTSLIAAAAIGGVGISALGLSKSAKGASDQYAATMQIVQAEQAEEQQRLQMMALDAHRKQTELVRQAQKARALSLVTATGQGGQGGLGSTALAGAYGQTSGQYGTQSTAINENLGIGENMFALNSQISAGKLSMASAQTESSTGAGLMSLGGQLVSSAGAIGRIGSVLAPKGR